MHERGNLSAIHSLVQILFSEPCFRDWLRAPLPIALTRPIAEVNRPVVRSNDGRAAFGASRPVRFHAAIILYR